MTENKENKRKIGNIGEDAVVRFLIRNGCRVVCRNYTVKGGEIDIIAEDGKHTHIVEVKLRRGNKENAMTAIDERKLEKLTYTAECFIRDESFPEEIRGLPLVFDAAEVYLSENEAVVRYHANIFAHL